MGDTPQTVTTTTAPAVLKIASTLYQIVDLHISDTKIYLISEGFQKLTNCSFFDLSSLLVCARRCRQNSLDNYLF